MFWLFPLWAQVSLGLWVGALGLLYYFFTLHFNHWQKKGVKFEKGYPLVGSLAGAMTMREHLLTAFDKMYKKYQGERFVGFYQGRKPALLILDPELIKKILVKDFSYFYDHGFKFHEETDPLEALSLFNLEGKKWKDMRSKLAPTFTSGKIKMMTPLMKDVGKSLISHLTEISKSGTEFEAKDLFSSYTIDVIGSCVFGIQCNSIENPKNEFRMMGRKLFEFDFWRGIQAFVMLFMPEVAIKLRFALIDKNATNFFRKVVKDVMDMRQKTGQTRKDFMQLLIELKEKGQIANNDADDEKEIKQINGFESLSSSKTLSHDDLTAQATVFFLAGFETSSTLLSFTSLELAANTDIQRKLQMEIDESLRKHDNDLTFETLKEMTYLDCIFQETMRKYSPGSNLMRICTKNYMIPETNVQIEKGTHIIIPNYSFQHDPKYFPEPDNFRPERFAEDNFLHKNQFLHMPFGEGPRQCIGNRFALAQSKMGLASILSKFDLHLCERTDYPMTLDPSQFTITAVGGIWLKATPRCQD